MRRQHLRFSSKHLKRCIEIICAETECAGNYERLKPDFRNQCGEFEEEINPSFTEHLIDKAHITIIEYSNHSCTS